MLRASIHYKSRFHQDHFAGFVFREALMRIYALTLLEKQTTCWQSHGRARAAEPVTIKTADAGR